MVLRYFLPSVVDISGAGIKRTVVINQKRLKTKNKSTVIQILLTLMLPLAAVVSRAEKSTIVKNAKRLEHEKKVL